ncbi:uncharacterized protein LOC110053651 [Orbicella faveolata]|uniref:uncharacterized protein LOC110053651 n=1 Tax=Orbicella faveolata TaxID=48498 RepID=UPI0009E485D6|nr:uncharacterized protein LOC110053651 [Orbicella faveolata]
MRLSKLELPRCFCVNTCPEASIQLHVFADASEMGFGAVCYARYSLPNGTIKVSFVMARNRVAPLKQLSILRLELQAAVLAVRLYCVVKQELTVIIKDTIFWSDSKTVLQYIANESRRFHTFVANRVSEIYDTAGTFPVTVILPTIAPEAFERQIWIIIADGSMALPSCPNLKMLRAKKRLPVRSRLSALNPYVDEAKCLRVGGRLRKASVPEETRHALVLDPKHEITRLIVMHNHLRLYCTTNRYVLNQLRQKYWILKGLATVQRISSSCPSSRRLRAKPEPPVMADLPDSRLGYQQPPFANTGVDYFGPILVRHGRKTEKRYGVLFTCLTTRAVHLEIAHSLDTDSCLMAVRRIMARRGRPANIWSDNGNNFVGAEKELREALKRLDSERIGDQLSDERVQ